MCTIDQASTISPTATGSVNEANIVNPKLLKVLQKVVHPKCKLHNDDYLNLLFNHLTQPPNLPNSLSVEEQKSIMLFLPVWLKSTVAQFEKCKDPPNPQVLYFILNVSRHISSNEQTFVTLNSEDVFEKLIEIVKRVSKPSISVALIQLISVIVDHKSGLQWIISTNHWKFYVDLVLSNETVYILKEGNSFITKLLVKSVAFNSTFCDNVINTILTPLEFVTRKLTDKEDVSGNDFKWLVSTLQNLNTLLVGLLNDSKCTENDIYSLFVDKFKLTSRMKELISLSQNNDLTFHAMKLFITLRYHQMKVRFFDIPFISADSQDNPLYDVYDIYCQAVSMLPAVQTFHLLNWSFTCWVKIKSSMPMCLIKGHQGSLEDQILMIQYIPIFTVFIKFFGIKIYTEENDDLRVHFCNKYYRRICPRTVGVKYKWLPYFLDNFSFANGVLALKFVLHSKKLFPKDTGILAFQILFSLLHDFLVFVKENRELQLPFLKEPEYIALHLNVMEILIEEFDVTWKDSVETLWVMLQMRDLLSDFVWPTKIVVNALKLAKKTVSKYLTFQMALLIDDNQSTALCDFPILLKAKLHDGAWEIRDSSVELVTQFAISNCTSSDVAWHSEYFSRSTAKLQFESFKKAMLENDFPRHILDMSTGDGSPYVRSSALKCLQEIVKDETFWSNIVEQSDIFTILLRILQMETEGMVRSEAANLVGSIFEHQQIPDELLGKFYNAMSHAVVSDLHWEVRVSALKFWELVVDDRLTQQGMIDGSFPSVTFSVQKKIVTLNPAEIRKRLIAVLLELSEMGCLYVFYEALRDDCDLEVAKCATRAVANFADLLKQYEVTERAVEEFAPSSPLVVGKRIDEFPVGKETTMDLGFCSPSQSSYSECIMDEILDTRDLNLLESVLNSLDTPVMENVQFKERVVLSPIKFLDLVYGDLRSNLEDKTKAIRNLDSFQSLLDDILKEYEPDDRNAMDCY
ncbi:unnamed protein product [Phyllotreta striolata]|uniref:BRCA1-associated ATM activator 1 n=1 Tax=Phyllotreta striolata TaxID=444603 RepID=A0A9N9TNK1_PHYSR|nr:unnamed protein product [Phyllotreta striolata]